MVVLPSVLLRLRAVGRTSLTKFARDDAGQALVVVALSFVVLLGAVALGLDWGYGLTQRRVMVNSAEAGALAGAKLLATNVITDATSTPLFTVREEYVYCVALNAATANRDYRPESNRVETTIVEWNTDPLRRDAVTNEPIYTRFAGPPAGGCPAPGTPITAGTLARPEIRYVRVRTEVTYRPLLASVLGQSSITAMGVGAARITGAKPPEPGPTWPLVRHYNEADFNTTCRRQCSPDNSDPVVFWSSQDDDLVYGNKKGLVDFSRFSPNALLSAPAGTVCPRDPAPFSSTSCVPQLMEDWDRRGPVIGVSPDVSGNCRPIGAWQTGGNEDPQNWDKQCSIPNWAYHLFGGELSLRSDRTSIVWNGVTEFREPPTVLPTGRAVCAPNNLIDKPSCANGRLGDWVEIADTGNLGIGIADPLRRYIREQQKVDEFFLRPTPTGNGTYGYYAVITIYLWDCAETYDGSKPAGQRWSLTLPKLPKSDCSDIRDGNDLRSGHSPDRVHLFTAVPFTFYEGLVSSNEIRGFWGGGIGDATSCQAVPAPANCQLNAISNGVFLVPPD